MYKVVQKFNLECYKILLVVCRRIKKFEGKAFFVAYFKVVDLYMVGCQCIVQLGGLVLGSPRFVPISLGLVSLFYSLKSPLY